MTDVTIAVTEIAETVTVNAVESPISISVSVTETPTSVLVDITESPTSVSVAITETPVTVTVNAVQGIEEAPVDGTTYGRKDADWVVIENTLTLGTANGLSLAGQVLSLGLASAGVTGALSGADWSTFNAKQDALTLPLSAANGGTGIANGASASLTLPNLALTLAAAGAYTLTIPATGTAALLGTANVFTAVQKINVNSTTAFSVEQDGVKDNVLVVDTAYGFVGINRAPLVALDIVGAASGHAFRVRGADGYGFVVRNPGDTQDLISFAGGSTSGALKLYYNGTLVSQISSYPDQLYFCINATNFAIGVTSGLEKLHVVKTTTTANAVLQTQRIEARVSTAATGAANGFGVGQSFYAETATDATYQQQGLISTSWIDSTNASRKAKMSLSAYDTAARLGLEIEASGTAVKLGFFGGTTAIQQVLAAYTSDGEGAAYTGIDNAQAGTVYATVADLNQLRVAYETLRASYDDLRTKLQTSTIVG